MTTRRSRTFQIAFLLLTASLCTGYVKTEKRDFVKYDEKNDSFKLMRIFTNIRESRSEDFDRLENFRKQKDYLLFDPTHIDFFETQLYFKMTKYNYISSYFESESASDREIHETKIDLDSIKIVAGDFYVNFIKD